MLAQIMTHTDIYNTRRKGLTYRKLTERKAENDHSCKKKGLKELKVKDKLIRKITTLIDIDSGSQRRINVINLEYNHISRT